MPSSDSFRLTKEESFYLKKLEGLHVKAVKTGQTVFTSFISPQILAHLKSLQESHEINCRIFRINPFAEQVMMAFVPHGLEIPDEDFPVSVLEIISPTPQEVSHRDILGSIMGLGIKREMIGDIFLDDQQIFIVAAVHMTDFLKENLLTIGRHPVRLEESTIQKVADIQPTGEERLITASSRRMDLLVSKVFNLSRSKSQLLFSQGKVKCNHLLLIQYKKEMNVGDLLSVRGSGRFRLLEEAGTTRKGNVQLRIQVFR